MTNPPPVKPVRRSPFADRLFGWAAQGAALLTLGFITGLVALYYRFALLHGYRPLLYLVILFVLAGVLLFSLGFLTELIGQLLERLERIEKRDRRVKNEEHPE